MGLGSTEPEQSRSEIDRQHHTRGSDSLGGRDRRCAFPAGDIENARAFWQLETIDRAPANQIPKPEGWLIERIGRRVVSRRRRRLRADNGFSILDFRISIESLADAISIWKGFTDPADHALPFVHLYSR